MKKSLFAIGALLFSSMPAFSASVSYTFGLRSATDTFQGFFKVVTSDFIPSLPEFQTGVNWTPLPVTSLAYCTNCRDLSNLIIFDGIKFFYTPETGMRVQSVYGNDGMDTYAFATIFSRDQLASNGFYSGAQTGPNTIFPGTLLVQQLNDPVTYAPEPATYGGVAIALIALGVFRRRLNLSGTAR